MRNAEHYEQVALFQWAAMMEERIPQLAMMFAVPNGGQRHKAVAAKLKAEGVKSGIPDICLAYPMDEFHGLFIEMKAGKNRTTANQNEWIQRLLAAGYMAVVCYGFEAAKKEILDYLEIENEQLYN